MKILIIEDNRHENFEAVLAVEPRARTSNETLTDWVEGRHEPLSISTDIVRAFDSDSIGYLIESGSFQPDLVLMDLNYPYGAGVREPKPHGFGDAIKIASELKPKAIAIVSSKREAGSNHATIFNFPANLRWDETVPDEQWDTLVENHHTINGTKVIFILSDPESTEVGKPWKQAFDTLKKMVS